MISKELNLQFQSYMNDLEALYHVQFQIFGATLAKIPFQQ